MTIIFDLIILFQVLEHLADPLAAIERGAELLATGGMLLIAVPSFARWQSRVFGSSWVHLDVRRHLHRFSPKAFAHAFEHVGLTVVSTRFASFEHDPYGWIQRALNTLGFKQNLLTKWLMGMPDQEATLIAMLVISALLAVPSVVLALVALSCVVVPPAPVEGSWE